MIAATNTTRELVLTRNAWESAVRSLMLDSNRYAVGTMRWNSSPERIEWLVDQFDLTESLPHGQDQLPLMSSVVLTIERAPVRTPDRILQQIAPRDSQTIAIVTLNHSDRSRWEGIVHHDGVRMPLDGVRVIGPGMLHLERSRSDNLDDIEPLPTEGRWSRTMGALGPRLWRQVTNAHVLLIGCGRNGTLAAWQLAGLGVQRLTLVDPDRLELENLDAMPGLALTDVGLPKATAIAHRLVAFNPELCVRCLTEPVTDILQRLRSRFDLVVTCVDRDTPRLAAAWLSRELLIPHLDIGTAVRRVGHDQLTNSGDVRLLLPFAGCVQCVGGIANVEDTMYELAAPPQSLHRGAPVPWNEQRAGSLVHLNAVTVGTAFELWLSFLNGRVGSFWQRIAWNSAGGLDADGAAVDAHANCPHCRPA